jgi:hypothetical protein
MVLIATTNNSCGSIQRKTPTSFLHGFTLTPQTHSGGTAEDLKGKYVGDLSNVSCTAVALRSDPIQ